MLKIHTEVAPAVEVCFHMAFDVKNGVSQWLGFAKMLFPNLLNAAIHRNFIPQRFPAIQYYVHSILIVFLYIYF